MSDQQKKDLRKQISNNLSRGTLTPDNSAVLILSHIADALEDLATMAKYLATPQENAVPDETPSLTPELIEKYKICRPVDTLVGEKYKTEEPSETSEVFNPEPVAMPVFHAGTGKKFGEKSKS